MLALVGMVTSHLIITTTAAHAAESIPEVQWPAVTASPNNDMVTSPQGHVTMGCSQYDTYQDLVTYNTTGAVVRQISRTSQIDGVNNCISFPVVDKLGDLYGTPSGGRNLLAYKANTLKWKYFHNCTFTNRSVAVGGNGNIYTLDSNNHLIGLTPNVEPGTDMPKKILDIPVASGCEGTLQAFRDGIMVEWNAQRNREFYTYSGKKLEPGSAAIGRMPVNADGRVFEASYQASGSLLRSATVTAYDITKGRTWSRRVSLDGAYVFGASRYPTPDGGVFIVMEEKKLEGGVTTEEMVLTLIKLNASGTPLWSKTIPNQDGNGNNYNHYKAVVDTGGKLTLVRGGELATNNPSRREGGISIGVFDGAGTVVYNKVMHGNLQEADGATAGYRLQDITIGVDTLFLRAAPCSGNYCDVTNTKLYPLRIPSVRTDSPRGTVLYANTGPQPAPRSYVSLGDSFSSGHGNSPYMDGTACLRSTQSYARVLGTDPTTTLQLDKFVACSGAKTTHILNGWQDEPPQINALSDNPKAVTITIGGNNIEFTAFGIACVLGTCNFGSAEYLNSRRLIDTALGADLEATYTAILEATKAAGTKIGVLGYPQVVKWKSSSDPFDARCTYMYDGPNGSGYWEEARAANDIVSRLNLKIVETVEKLREQGGDNLRLDFISATQPGGPFEGHEMCSSGESYFLNVDQTGGSFHPNVKGQAAYAKLVRAFMGE